jgi:hypothetical protein
LISCTSRGLGPAASYSLAVADVQLANRPSSQTASRPRSADHTLRSDTDGCKQDKRRPDSQGGQADREWEPTCADTEPRRPT